MTFAAAINCMDGRVQQAVIGFVKDRYGVAYVDVITGAGPNKVLAQGTEQERLASIRSRVEISVTAHGSKMIAIFAHEDCAGNPVARAEHEKHLKQAAERVRSWGLDVERIETFWVASPFTQDAISPVE